jgi:hypothetical protein
MATNQLQTISVPVDQVSADSATWMSGGRRNRTVRGKNALQQRCQSTAFLLSSLDYQSRLLDAPC